MKNLKLGRLPADHSRPALDFALIWTGVTPIPAAVDYGSGMKFLMLGNDVVGDCVAVSWANDRFVVTYHLEPPPVYPTLAQVYEVYKTQNPGWNSPADGQGHGMVIQTLLKRLHDYGGPDGHKLLAYAKINPRDPAAVKAAIAIFGVLWVGLVVRSNNMTQYRNNQDWTYDPNSGVVGGHSVVWIGYTVDGKFRMVTWGKEMNVAASYPTTPDVDEMWIPIWPEYVSTTQFQEGIDMAALKAEYQRLTGQPLAIPDPPAPYAPRISMGTTNIKPQRLIDMRGGTHKRVLTQFTGTIPAYGEIEVPIAGQGRVGQDAVAIDGNLTVSSYSARGWAVITPTGYDANDPTSATNFKVGGAEASNAFHIGLSPTGTAKIKNGSAAPIQVLVDVTAYDTP